MTSNPGAKASPNKTHTRPRCVAIPVLIRWWHSRVALHCRRRRRCLLPRRKPSSSSSSIANGSTGDLDSFPSTDELALLPHTPKKHNGTQPIQSRSLATEWGAQLKNVKQLIAFGKELLWEIRSVSIFSPDVHPHRQQNGSKLKPSFPMSICSIDAPAIRLARVIRIPPEELQVSSQPGSLSTASGSGLCPWSGASEKTRIFWHKPRGESAARGLPKQMEAISWGDLRQSGKWNLWSYHFERRRGTWFAFRKWPCDDGDGSSRAIMMNLIKWRTRFVWSFGEKCGPDGFEEAISSC